MEHRAGYVNIIGNPNVGKSTLMNAFVGERLSIITSKAQTTRHRILGIVNGDDFQVLFSDTPGIIKPAYELQNSMMDFVKSAFEVSIHCKRFCTRVKSASSSPNNPSLARIPEIQALLNAFAYPSIAS